MPKRETPRQRRWSFAAEARGELPRGTALRWARETKRTERRETMAKKRRKHHGPKASHKVCSTCGTVYRRNKGHTCKGSGKRRDAGGFL
jgi:hypothetical protein